MAYLELVQGFEPGKRFPLVRGESVIGRSSDCDVAMDVAAVSRRHASVLEEGGRYYVLDLGSRNGTFLNAERITDQTPLRDGDRILVCDQELQFKQDRPRGLLGGEDHSDESSLVRLVNDDESDTRASVMATLDVGATGSGWTLSARPEAKLMALVEISNNLGKALSVEEILPKLLDSLFKIFVQADRGFVVMRTGPDGALAPLETKSRRAVDADKMRISRTIVEEAINSKRAILSADATSDARFSLAQSITDFQIRSMMCAPMIASDGEALGVIQIDTTNQRSRFTDEDLEVLAAVASQAANAIDNARMHEQMLSQRALQRDLELASRMQRALLPKGPPKAAGYHFFDYYEAARLVGGDYFDYVPLPDGRVGVVVGDVAGKGVSAAIIMARISSDVRFALATEPDPAKAMMQVNQDFARQNLSDRFVTMILAVIDPQKHELTVANAGHMAPLLRVRGGAVEEIGEEVAGLPLGVLEDYEYEAETWPLGPGDSVTIFTDGFSEAMNAERQLYGITRLSAQVGAAAVSVVELGSHIIDDVRAFVGGYAQSDDMCLTCFGRIEEEQTATTAAL